MKLSKVILGISLASGMGLATQAQAFSIGMYEIDNWDNLAASVAAADVATGTAGVFANRSGSAVGSLFVRENPNGLYANLFQGDGVRSIDCQNCQEGHFVSDANSIGNGYFSWVLPQGQGTLNLSNLEVVIDYAADVDGVDVIVSAFNNGGNLQGQVWFKDVVAPGLPGTEPEYLKGSFGNGVAGITRVVLETVTVGGVYNPAVDSNYRGGFAGSANFGAAAFGADVNYDNIIPEIDALAGTGALTLLVGALALAGERRRRSA
jgi:hypothetical protein